MGIDKTWVGVRWGKEWRRERRSVGATARLVVGRRLECRLQQAFSASSPHVLRSLGLRPLAPTASTRSVPCPRLRPVLLSQPRSWSSWPQAGGAQSRPSVGGDDEDGVRWRPSLPACDWAFARRRDEHRVCHRRRRVMRGKSLPDRFAHMCSYY